MSWVSPLTRNNSFCRLNGALHFAPNAAHSCPTKDMRFGSCRASVQIAPVGRNGIRNGLTPPKSLDKFLILSTFERYLKLKTKNENNKTPRHRPCRHASILPRGTRQDLKTASAHQKRP